MRKLGKVERNKMDLTLHQFDLPLRHPFTISRETVHVKRTLIVELTEDGVSGFGEATVHDYYGYTIENMTKSLLAVRGQIESGPPLDPPALWDQLDKTLRNNRGAQCALDEAAHDLWGKRAGLPVHAMWGLDPQSMPLTSYTIGIDTIEVMVDKMREFPGWPIYKIKLGTSRDAEIVRELRRHTDAVFRVDANCGWSLEETRKNAVLLQSLGVEFIEQPLPADDWQGIAALEAECALPLIADESCVGPTDVDRCCEYFDGINIKLIKCGGLTPARRMIARARQLGRKVMVGCMTESSVGISAVAQLLPLVDYADVDGALLLDRDIASGVTVERGAVRFPQENGCGVRLL